MSMGSGVNGRTVGVDQALFVELIKGTRVVLPNPAGLGSPPRRQRVDPLLAGAKGGRRACRGYRESTSEILKGGDLIKAATAMSLDDWVRRGFRDAGYGNRHLQAEMGTETSTNRTQECKVGCKARKSKSEVS